jgi:mono/diheme cytochrome c family protein
VAPKSVLAGSFIVLLLAFSPAAFAVDPPGSLWVKAKCALCHATDGSGDTSQGKQLKVQDLRREELRKWTDEELSKAVAGGHKKMPSFGSQLTQEQVRFLVFYIRELQKPPKQ